MRKAYANESHVKDDVKELLKSHGAWYVMPIGGSFSAIGVPDFVACVYGKLWGIETKFGSNKPTPMQQKNLRDIEAAGGVAMVITEKNIIELSERLTKARFDKEMLDASRSE